MLAKVLAVFFVVISASPVNAPFYTFDLGELLNDRGPGRLPRDGVVSNPVSKHRATSDAQPNLPVSVRPLDELQVPRHLIPAIVAGVVSVVSHDTACHLFRTPVWSLQVVNVPPVAVLRL